MESQRDDIVANGIIFGISVLNDILVDKHHLVTDAHIFINDCLTNQTRPKKDELIMSIRTKLILYYMGIVLVILLAIYGYLDHSLKQNLSEQITTELKVQANLTREFLLEMLPDTFLANPINK